MSGQTSWDDSENPNLTAHFVRAVADLAARSVHLLDPFRLRSRHGVRRHPPSLTYDGDGREESDLNIHCNMHRITHHIEVEQRVYLPMMLSFLTISGWQEPNVGRGYIKELRFSPDGRVIASPFGKKGSVTKLQRKCADK